VAEEVTVGTQRALANCDTAGILSAHTSREMFSELQIAREVSNIVTVAVTESFCRIANSPSMPRLCSARGANE
jgi:hypothetical protein